jgi:hypothetical protein
MDISLVDERTHGHSRVGVMILNPPALQLQSLAGFLMVTIIYSFLLFIAASMKPMKRGWA